jgi:hypothetical protein
MNPLDTIREWLNKYTGFDRLQDLRVDYYSQQPDNGSIDPSGVQIISITEDILGNKTVDMQYNFGVYFVLAKDPGDEETAGDNAAWVMDFQRWVNEQSILHLAPTFGDVPKTESIKAQNGAVTAADNEGVAIYMVQLSVSFTKIYEVN